MPDAVLERGPSVTLTPLAVRREEAAALLGVSLSTLDRAAKTGKLGPIPNRRLGVNLYVVSELEAWTETGMPPRDVWLKQHRGRDHLKLAEPA